jgi:outer membrane protein TolC
VTTIPERDALIAGLRQRADIQALAAQRDSAVQIRKFAAADMMPTVGFTGSLQYQQDGLGQFWSGDNRSFQAGIAVSVPLLNAPKVRAQRSRGHRAGTASRTRDQRDARRGAAGADDGGSGAGVGARAGGRAAQGRGAGRESLSIAEVSYENGVITSSELNDARVSLMQTEWALAQAKYGVIVAGARTRFAAGL